MKQKKKKPVTCADDFFLGTERKGNGADADQKPKKRGNVFILYIHTYEGLSVHLH